MLRYSQLTPRRALPADAWSVVPREFDRGSTAGRRRRCGGQIPRGSYTRHGGRARRAGSCAGDASSASGAEGAGGSVTAGGGGAGDLVAMLVMRVQVGMGGGACGFVGGGDSERGGGRGV
jgi:hypothetical protein